jgi:hypothetical protein
MTDWLDSLRRPRVQRLARIALAAWISVSILTVWIFHHELFEQARKRTANFRARHSIGTLNAADVHQIFVWTPDDVLRDIFQNGTFQRSGFFIASPPCAAGTRHDSFEQEWRAEHLPAAQFFWGSNNCESADWLIIVFSDGNIQRRLVKG